MPESGRSDVSEGYQTETASDEVRALGSNDATVPDMGTEKLPQMLHVLL